MIELLRQRRSIRKYKDQPLPTDMINVLKEAALRSPTSRDLHAWRFVFVTDRDLLKKLSRAKPHGASFLKNAPLGVVVCGNPAECDVWVEDAAIAAAILQLTAQSLGLGSCWIQIRNRQYDEATSSNHHVRSLLELDPGLEVASIIAIGFADEKREPLATEELCHERLWSLP